MDFPTFIKYPTIRNAALLLAVVLWLGGCATQQTQPSAPSAAPGDGEILVTNRGHLREAPPGADRFDADSEPMFQIIAAEFAGQRGRLDLAVQNYLAAAKSSRSLEVVERAARIAVFARQYDAAVEATNLWVELDPEDAEARQILAAMFIRKGDAESARTHLEVVLNSDPEAESRQLRMIVNLLGREQDKQTALAVMEKLLEKRTADTDAAIAYALLAIRAERLDEAARGIERVVELDAIDANLAMAYVAVLQKHEKNRDALEWLEQTLKQHPDEGIRMVYARLLADVNRYDDARRQFELLRDAAPDNTDVLYALGLLNLQAERVDEAEQLFERLAELDARKQDAVFYLGQIDESRENYDRALERYRSVTSGQNYFQAQVRVALILSNLERTDAALAQLKSIRAETSEQKRHLVRAEAEILTQDDQLDAAMAVYDAALVDTYDMELLYTRAMLAERMGKLDILERDLRRIIEREPENSQALNALGYTLADRTDRYEEALELIEKALSISPDDFYILDSMGWVMYRLGRFAEAVSFLQRAREIRNDPEVAAHLGEVLWVMGNKDEARALLDNAIKDTPDDERLLEVIERLEP